MVLNRYISHRNEFKITKSIHSANSLMITLSGEYVYTESGATKKVLPYSPVVYKKGKPFERHVIKPIRYILISLSHIEEDTDNFLEFSDSDRHRLKNTVDHLEEAIANGRDVSVIEHFVNDILLTAGMSKVKNGRDTDTVVAYIKEHFCEKLTLDALASVANYSKQTLITKFKADYKKTPVEYITQLRINKAKELLINSDLSVASIAEACGYDNVYYFSNIFKRHEKLSPLKFRQSTIL